MMELHNFVLFFILFSSKTAFTLQSNLKKLKIDNISSSIIHNIDMCSLYHCEENEICVIENDEPSCKIRENLCEPNPCKNGGSCTIRSGEILCDCMAGYSGPKCEIGCDTGSCQECNCCQGYGLKPLIFGKECLKCDCGKEFGCEFYLFGDKICHCPDEYTENSGKCVEKCSLITCQNNGQCVIKDGKATCNCTEDYTGEHCETGKCSLIKCLNDGVCAIKNGEATCKCTERYTGKHCEVDKCSQIKCENGGTCIIKRGKAVCECTEKYTGTFCQTDLISMNNSGDNIFVNFNLYKNRSLPRSSKFDFHFNMKETSNRTLTQILLRLNMDSAAQPDINKCSLIKCENGGKCSVENGKAVCTCTEKYTGMSCEIDKCSLMICLNGGKYEVRNQKTLCVCPENFTGDFCERRNALISPAALQME